MRRLPGVTKWQKWTWKPVAVLPGSADADWSELRRDGDAVEYHAATPRLELFRGETEAYLVALSDHPPCVYVIMRPSDDNAQPPEVLTVTASPYEAQDYCDTGEEIVEKVVMPEALVAWVRGFVETHHEEEVFVKRKRNRAAVDAFEDGIGDARIAQTSDVYRSPHSIRRERLN